MLEDYTKIPALESTFLYLFMFHVMFISYCIKTIVCQFPLDTCIYVMFLTMEVFTTSWWVVNQSIVAIIFLFASTCYKLIYPTLGGVKPLF